MSMLIESAFDPFFKDRKLGKLQEDYRRKEVVRLKNILRRVGYLAVRDIWVRLFDG